MSHLGNKHERTAWNMALATGAVVIVLAAPVHAADAQRGAQVFRACAACHSLEPGKNMTGPSLAGIVGRPAATVESFSRYSPALKSAHLTWDAKTLDAWLADPAKVVPGNRMTFPGLKDARARDDLIAFLERASAGAPPAAAQGSMPGVGGMMGGGQVPNLKQPTPAQRVTAIGHCRDTYHVTTADGETHDFWERNLRLKTDASEDGPPKGTPALVRAGMMGDRADVIFAAPDEISAAIKPQC